MSAAIAYEPDTLVLPELLGKQVDWDQSASARKVLRVGRRGSKTRFAMVAAIAGHGPGEPGSAKFGGILDGGDVLWVAVDYPQLTTVLWREEIVPRFGDLSWATLNSQQHTLEARGLGTLFLRSAEALTGVRGMGKNLKGIIIDEAAHFDLEGALLNEVLPTLLDNKGWLVIMSTTNAGPDGNQDKCIPSFFNLICEGIRAGDPRFAGWEEFYATAFDNPVIDDDAINELIGLYPPDSPQLKQEVFAELLRAGVGLALPNLTITDHIEQYPVGVAQTAKQWGAFDWGFNHPWVFGWYADVGDGCVLKRDTLTGRGDLPEAICAKILASGAPISDPWFVIHAGADIKQRKGRAVGYTGPTIAEVFASHGLKCIIADDARVLGLDNLRRYVSVNDETGRPRFTMADTAGNRSCLAQMQAMQLDPKNMEDVLKVDADSAGRGGDDFYDETRYGLMARPIAPQIRKASIRVVEQDRSAGYDFENRRVAKPESAEEMVGKMIERARPHITANRYQVPRR